MTQPFWSCGAGCLEQCVLVVANRFVRRKYKKQSKNIGSSYYIEKDKLRPDLASFPEQM